MNVITDVKEGSGNSLLIGGYNYSKGPFSADFVLACYDVNGKRDPSFGNAGVVISQFS